MQLTSDLELHLNFYLLFHASKQTLPLPWRCIGEVVNLKYGAIRPMQVLLLISSVQIFVHTGSFLNITLSADK